MIRTHLTTPLRFLGFLALLLSYNAVNGQDSTSVRLEGKVIDNETQSSISYFMIVNKSTGSGTFGDASGNFILNATINDTILVGAYGFTTQNFIIPHPTGESKTVKQTFYLEKLALTLQEVVIIPERELKEIKEDIDKLGYEEKDYKISGVNAIEHPITFLYQAFSKRERSIRKLAELENEVRRRDLLKELFRKYVDYDIITLNDSDFDDFIDYCNISDFMLQNTSQLEFIKIIQTRYKGYQIYAKRKKASPVYKKIRNE